MPDTVHRIPSRAPAILARGASLLGVLVLLLAAVPGAARADGDPASDVLLAQQTFVPWDADASASETARLDAVVAAAGARGYPVRVAVIASASDLGSVTQLWLRPQTYAEYLGIELSLAFHGSVIVVMPNGDGVYHAGITTTAAAAALARSRTRGGPSADAIAAVRGLAAAAGHPLPSTAPTISATAAPGASSSGAADWIVFAIGAALVALAWAASVRMRPLGGRPAGD